MARSTRGPAGPIPNVERIDPATLADDKDRKSAEEEAAEQPKHDPNAWMEDDGDGDTRQDLMGGSGSSSASAEGDGGGSSAGKATPAISRASAFAPIGLDQPIVPLAVDEAGELQPISTGEDLVRAVTGAADDDPSDEQPSEERNYTVQSHDDERWRVPISHAENQTIFEYRPDLRASYQESETDEDIAPPQPVGRAIHPDLPETVRPLPHLPPKPPEEATLGDSDDGSAGSGDATAGSGDGSVDTGDATAGSGDGSVDTGDATAEPSDGGTTTSDYSLGDGSDTDTDYGMSLDPSDSTIGSSSGAEPPHGYATDVVFEDSRPELERVDLGQNDELPLELQTDDSGLEELGG